MILSRESSLLPLIILHPLPKMASSFASLYLYMCLFVVSQVAVLGVTPDGPCGGKDLYSVLDVSREAKPREIKRAMVTLAKLWLAV